MGSTPLTLAALATSAVADLVVTGARTHTRAGEQSFVAAVLSTDLGEVIVRVPNTSQAETVQAGEVLGQSALTDGARAVLPFDVPRTLGQTRAGNTRAVVSSFLPGNPFAVAALAEDALLLQPLAETLAAIHELPHAIVREQGLPVLTAAETRANVARLVDRAIATRLVPSTVADRWREALESAQLWQFEPTVVHGTVQDDRFLVEDDRVTGVLGWSGLAVGDPATDLSWLAGAGEEVLESVLARYTVLRSAGDRQILRARALFLHELEVGQWLLYGVDRHDQTVIDDAVAMLDRLVDRLSYLPGPVPGREVLDVHQVNRLLADDGVDSARGRGGAAAEPFPEDEQQVTPETDFLEPLDPGYRPDAATPAPAAGEQLTEPIEFDGPLTR